MFKAGNDLRDCARLAFTPDSKALVAASQEKRIYVWDLAAPNPDAQPSRLAQAQRLGQRGRDLIGREKDGLGRGDGQRVVVWDTATWKVDREWVLLSGAVLRVGHRTG